ncbi:hypothetical protein MTX26_15910 [Bradyrhizobium sp. ISRA443]|uniref:hypothetical protein n=1 Tax=unclassified Bradyrhizobium TaxID=2631580 RepID=UPI002479BF42|nr:MULTISPECIES: hypothetical protein [unclassified Bradyrhizobium]WGS02213.1 hypothetical protein MTX23_15920 [Bradyrhizobium sp. ISRA436]WGS09098.1 hypothetical protein MTX18_15910 [Bradyrhizobium sp. ISRA437]WGS15987.1 hypothetical protein MTX26_15910 [Bradyrhizobium sp. ISRA443]
MNDRWLTRADAVDVVRKHVGCSSGRAEAILKAALHSGEVRDDRPMFAADDGIASIGSRGQQFSEYDLADWLCRNHGAPKVAVVASVGRRGRRSTADWDAVELALREEIRKRGFPNLENDDPAWRLQADVETWAAELLEQRKEPIKESRVREKIAEMLKRIEAGN